MTITLYQTDHTCNSYIQDGVYVFQCTQCDYIRKWNPLTDEVKTNGGEEGVTHSGSVCEMDDLLDNLN